MGKNFHEIKAVAVDINFNIVDTSIEYLKLKKI